jgi:flagellar hook protein FlgE
MGISNALFSGISGLNTLGNAMSVIGDNIANVNTIGFKSSRSTFETVLAQSVAGASGTSQVGRGVALSAIDANFSQGSFESTSEPTDMAIGGKGFFMVRSDQTGLYYTRAGHFRFDEEGFMVNPADLYVQGWALDSVTGDIDGGLTDIRIPVNSSAPNPTGMIDIAANLDASAEILDTGASVDSGQNSTSGFIFTSGTNDTLDYDGTNLSIIADGGLEENRVYSGAEVAAALETALPADITVVYNDVNAPNAFTITNNSGGPLTVNDSGSISNVLGITGNFTITDTNSASTQDEREFYVQTGVNDSFQITVDGNPGSTGEPVSVRIDQNAYSGDELALEMERQINIALSAEGVSVDVRYDESNPLEKVFRITSSSRGTGSSIQLDPGTNNFLSTVRIAEYDMVTEGSGPTRGGFTQSTDPTAGKFLLMSGINNVIDVEGSPVNLLDAADLSTNQYYTGDELALGIEQAMADDGYTVTAYYEEANNTFNITNANGGPITIDWAASSAADMLGYTPVSQPLADGQLATSDTSVAFNIVAGENDALAITVDGNPITEQEVAITIDPGSYTADALANELERAINDQLLSDGEPGRVVVSYDAVDGFIIESSTLGVDGSIQINAVVGEYDLVEEVLNINDFTLNNGSGFMVEEPDDSSNYSTSLPVYDSLGNQHNVTIYFRKAVETDSSAIWEWFAYVPGGDTQSGEPEVQARGSLTFNNSGVLTGQPATTWLNDPDGFHFINVDPGQEVDIDFGFNSGTNVTTQFSSSSSTIYQTQDGYGSGYLQDVAVDPDGKITGNYSNGQVLYLAQVALANFTNPWGLSREGGNNYAATNASGIAVTAEPGTSGTGRISPNSLEQSNVDLSTEFVAMIIQQRGFQANSKVITTTDSMLAELINLKR